MFSFAHRLIASVGIIFTSIFGFNHASQIAPTREPTHIVNTTYTPAPSASPQAKIKRSPIHMTRAEYQAKYGQPPPIPNAPVSNIPIQETTPTTPETTRHIYPIRPLGDISRLDNDAQANIVAAYSEFRRIPDLEYTTLQQQEELFKQTAEKYILQYKTQLEQKTQDAQNKLRQQQEKKAQVDALLSDYQSKINQIDQQILTVKQKYYSDADRENGSPWLSQRIRDARIQRLATDADTEIQKLQLQKESLRLEYLNKINALQ